MENFIFVIIGVLFFAYQTYANYKKEQEAAKNRRPSSPRKSEPIQKQGEREAPSPAPLEIPRWLESILQPQTEASPKQEQPRQFGEYENDYQEYVPTELPADLQAEYQNRSDTKEIERTKKLKALPNTNQYEIKSLEPHTFEEGEEENGSDIPIFDLRQGIIMNAILTRPDY